MYIKNIRDLRNCTVNSKIKYNSLKSWTLIKPQRSEHLFHRLGFRNLKEDSQTEYIIIEDKTEKYQINVTKYLPCT